MRLIYHLIKLGFFNLRTWFFIIKAQRIHGRNLSLLLKYASDKFGDKIAISDEENTLTFSVLYEKVLRLSYIIHTVVQPTKETVVILVCRNQVADVLVLYALQNMGVKTILMHPKTTVHDIQKITQTQNVNYCVFTSSPISSTGNCWNIDAFLSQLNQPHTTPFISKKCSKILFTTSGTTGNPTLIAKRAGVFYWLYPFVDLIIRTKMQKCQAAYIVAPIAHSFGYTALLFGVVLGKKTFFFETKDKEYVCNRIIEEKIDMLVGVPTSLYGVAESLRGMPHVVDLIMSSASPLNEVILHSLANISKNIFSMYGSTEASTSFIADYEDLSKNTSALGKPLQGVKYRLKPLESGGWELCIHSKLANIVAADGWVYTGDLAEEKANGLVWCGRKDDMILKNGVNIYPIEIENELLQFPEVEDACVVGKQDAIKGEIIVAFITSQSLTPLSAETIKSFLENTLPTLKIPDKIYQIEKFDYTHTGKKKRNRHGES